MSCKEEFIEIFKEKITRPGADALLNYLENKSDFFTAPASARYHLACEGGLCEHSLNVYHCLVDYLQRERVQELYGLEYSTTSSGSGSRSCTAWSTARRAWPWRLCSTTCAKWAAIRKASAT